MPMQLKAGSAQRIVTPPVGTLLMGYAPARPGTSVNDELTVSAFALEYGSVRAILISASIAIFDNDKADHIRRMIADATGVPFGNIIACTTHTHSGPETAVVHGWSTLNAGYYTDILEPQTLAAAQEAIAALQNVRVGIGTTQSDVGVNRRSIDRHGKIGLGQCPWGYYDPTMTVISFRGEQGIVGNIIHYCAHATAAGKNDEITRDWPGPMEDRLTAQSGGMSAFFNGAIGDTGPRLPNGSTTGDLQMALELGAKAGIDAVQAWRSIKEWRAMDMDIIHGEVKLPYSPLPPLELAREQIQHYPNPDELVGMPRAEYVRWRNIIAEYESGHALETHFHQQQSILRIGPAVIVPFPQEMFVEMTLRLRHYSPYQHTLCLSNANGAYAYFPTQDQICRGGYEIDAIKLCNTYILAPDADEAAISQNLALIEALHQRQQA